MFSKQFCPFKDFSKYREVIKIHCSLHMQECRFEFDTGCGNDSIVHFSNDAGFT